MALTTDTTRRTDRRPERWTVPGVGGAIAEVARFVGVDGVPEVHVTVRPGRAGSLDEQLGDVVAAYRTALASAGLNTSSAVFRRFSCSDLPNQAATLAACPLASRGGDCAVSWVGQAPLPPAKVALWAWHVDRAPGGELTHLWSANRTAPGADTAEQTRGLLLDLEAGLAAHGCSLRDHLVRTWFFVADIDRSYGGLVTARREFFADRGLLPGTHFIASTGIEGRPADAEARIALDTYAIAGLRREQVRYLQALDHLSPTHRYGVTFERGTAIDYRDRRQIFISGTASIDRDGQIAWPGDAARQLERTIENIEALLASAEAGLDDLLAATVYLRDPADGERLGAAARQRLAGVPLVTVHAPVCRPGWLVEIECLAMTAIDRPDLPPF